MRWSLLAVFPVLWVGCGLFERPRAEGTSVLWITLDTTRRDHMGFYGSEAGLTPNLDALAATARIYDDARTQVAITLPSHVSMFTGKSVLDHGVRENGTFALSSDATTFAEVLDARGFDTAAFVSTFVLDARFGLAQGFDVFDDEMSERRREDWIGFEDQLFERDARATTEAALAWLSGRGETPWMLWAHYYDPHFPYDPPGAATDDKARAYAGEIAHMDAQVGRLLRAAEKRADDLLVVVVSDHGESLGEQGVFGHGHDVAEPSMRAVWLMHHASLKKGRVTERTPTFRAGPEALAVLGLDPSVLEPTPWTAGDPLYEESVLGVLRGTGPAWHGLLDGDFALVQQGEPPEESLYDLAADPLGANDLAARLPHVVDRMRPMLRAELDRPPGTFAVPQRADPDVVEALEALGYIAP